MPRVYSSARTKILDATERLILRDGPQGLSVDAVLREAAVSKGGFFHHFKTKDALLAALLERLAGALNDQLARASQHGRGVLPAMISIAFDMPHAERERTRALVLALLAAVMDAPRVAKAARDANAQSLTVARQSGVDVGVALVVQLALDGYFLGESFGTLKLDSKKKRALRDTLMDLVQRRPKGAHRAP
jgi:AcrR family transcriptional regulator